MIFTLFNAQCPECLSISSSLPKHMSLYFFTGTLYHKGLPDLLSTKYFRTSWPDSWWVRILAEPHKWQIFYCLHLPPLSVVVIFVVFSPTTPWPTFRYSALSWLSCSTCSWIFKRTKSQWAEETRVSLPCYHIATKRNERLLQCTALRHIPTSTNITGWRQDVLLGYSSLTLQERSGRSAQIFLVGTASGHMRN